MILVDREIQALCEAGMIKPFNTTMLNPQSIDVRIGLSAKVEANPNTFRRVFAKVFRWIFGLPKPAEKQFIDYDLSLHTKQNPLWVSPKAFTLTCTAEMLDIPPNIAGEFRLKSSRAREGWGHCLAVWIDGGFNNSNLTLELINERRWKSLPLYPYMPIGQIVFHQTAMPDRDYGETGRYNHDIGTQESKG